MQSILFNLRAVAIDRTGHVRPATRGCERSNQPVRGQSMVEFSLILPIFLLLIIGLMEFAFAFQRPHLRELREPRRRPPGGRGGQ